MTSPADWQLLAAKEPPRWTGDLNDDCTARWAGLTLRAEKMDRCQWWWCVYDDVLKKQVVSSNEEQASFHSGHAARAAAADAARRWLGLPEA